eukprot:TRINITY_DN12614_c0_g1_i1.p2 TRINITY_DN12614_c0_g1~~TRINITY_DN12614_c0_g1_i1.p2  ORF type:complete len:767 (+),score=213.16 TRINITY_DN12614_c0_g1_i1:94-2301(+)
MQQELEPGQFAGGGPLWSAEGRFAVAAVGGGRSSVAPSSLSPSPPPPPALAELADSVSSSSAAAPGTVEAHAGVVYAAALARAEIAKGRRAERRTTRAAAQRLREQRRADWRRREAAARFSESPLVAELAAKRKLYDDGDVHAASLWDVRVAASSLRRNYWRRWRRFLQRRQHEYLARSMQVGAREKECRWVLKLWRRKLFVRRAALAAAGPGAVLCAAVGEWWRRSVAAEARQAAAAVVTSAGAAAVAACRKSMLAGQLSRANGLGLVRRALHAWRRYADHQAMLRVVSHGEQQHLGALALRALRRLQGHALERQLGRAPVPERVGAPVLPRAPPPRTSRHAAVLLRVGEEVQPPSAPPSPSVRIRAPSAGGSPCPSPRSLPISGGAAAPRFGPTGFSFPPSPAPAGSGSTPPSALPERTPSPAAAVAPAAAHSAAAAPAPLRYGAVAGAGPPPAGAAAAAPAPELAAPAEAAADAGAWGAGQPPAEDFLPDSICTVPAEALSRPPPESPPGPRPAVAPLRPVRRAHHYDEEDGQDEDSAPPARTARPAEVCPVLYPGPDWYALPGMDRAEIAGQLRALALEHLRMARRRLGFVRWLAHAKRQRGPQFPTDQPWLAWAPPKGEYEHSSRPKHALPPPPRALGAAPRAVQEAWRETRAALLAEARGQVGVLRYVARFRREIEGYLGGRPPEWPWELPPWLPTDSEYAAVSATVSAEGGYRFVPPRPVVTEDGDCE